MKSTDHLRLQKSAAKHALIVVGLSIVMLCLLSRCVVVRAEWAKWRLSWLLGSLPAPSTITLVGEVTGIDGGSDKTCYTAYLIRLYGTNRSAEEILGYYKDMLLSKGEWKREKELPGDQWLTFYNHKDGFRLAIEHGVTADYLELPTQSIVEAQRQFDTLVTIQALHADKATRERCWVGWEP